MNRGGRSEVAAAIERLSREAAAGASLPEAREAAARTGGVPVHADLGGVLVLATDGSVLHYDPEGGRVSPVEDIRWQLLALVKAARAFPDLRQLRPGMPDTAVACERCGGRGVILGDLDCGACFGIGWNPEPPPPRGP